MKKTTLFAVIFTALFTQFAVAGTSVLLTTSAYSGSTVQGNDEALAIAKDDLKTDLIDQCDSIKGTVLGFTEPSCWTDCIAGSASPYSNKCKVWGSTCHGDAECEGSN